MIDYNRLRQIARSATKWEQVRPEDVRALLESHRKLFEIVNRMFHAHKFLGGPADDRPSNLIDEARSFHAE